MFLYSFYPLLMLRLPAYNYNLYTDADLAEIIKQEFFQKAIYFASETFYNELAKLNFELSKLDKKAVETTRKYFNRMCYRPTPFGLFAAVGVLKWGAAATSKIVAQSHRPHIRYSYAKSVIYANKFMDNIADGFIYRSNPTLYKTGSDCRFLKASHQHVQIDFIIDSLKTDRFFDGLMSFLDAGRNKAQLLNYIVKQTGCLQTEAAAYLQWLIDNQIINHGFEPNITGMDYLERVLSITQATHNAEQAAIASNYRQIKGINNVNGLHAIPGNLGRGYGGVKSADFYVNLNINLPEAELNTRYQQHILDGVDCLNKLSPQGQLPGGLKDFIARFNQKFEGRTIPLLTALDPEVGVGYGDLAVAGDDSNIAHNIQQAASTETGQMVPWGNIHTILFKKWQAIVPGNTAIVLTDDDLKGLNTQNDGLPPGISVMFRVAGGKVFIESAGGVCASSLIGRFTLLNDEIEQMACSLAAKEAAANPGVVFAEIAHICHSHTANIDRRCHIYPYEIPVLVQSTMPPERQILPADLLVCVTGGQVVLLSKRLGKRVVPRLSSAFNYTRNDLALFRFLCDLQRAGLKTQFDLNLSNLFPGLGFYPRVEYKNAILHLALWDINKTLLTDILNAHGAERLTRFNQLRQQLKLPPYIALSQSDNQLVFNLDNDADVFFFLDIIKNQKQIIIKEFLRPNPNNAVVVNGQGKPYVNQFITSLYHERQVYKPVNLPAIVSARAQRKIIPGAGWLYLKIYCHPVRANDLLGGLIFKPVKKMLTGSLISKWFYVRYNDPDAHIRLRLAVEPHQQQQVLNLLYKLFNAPVNDGIISNYIIATYERELERYGAEYIDCFESVFCASSNLVMAYLHQLAHGINTTNTLKFALITTSHIITAAGLSGISRIGFLEQVFNSFFNEFSAIGNLKHQLDAEYRNQKTIIEQAMANAQQYYKELQLHSAAQLLTAAVTELAKRKILKNNTGQQSWLADVVHMHLNRVFANQPRIQEMMVYYFLLKYACSVKARAGKAAAAVKAKFIIK